MTGSRSTSDIVNRVGRAGEGKAFHGVAADDQARAAGGRAGRLRRADRADPSSVDVRPSKLVGVVAPEG
jgi:hypothetical protein